MINEKLKYMNSSSQNQHKSRHLIGNWELPRGDILAPMSGVTDSPFRRIAKRFGCGLLYSECISAEGVRRLGGKSLQLGRFHDEERPIAIQLFGSDPAQFADAAGVIAERFKPDMIDINCGCPVKRFVTRNCGGFLMQDPALIGNIVAQTRRACSLPVSVKLRSGYRSPDETAVNAALAAVDAGASLVAVHGRYVRGSKDSTADWNVIARVKNALPDVPVIGNGDVFSRDDAQRMMRETGCDRAMIGRWACGRPWIFAGLTQAENLESPAEPPFHERISILIDQYRLELEEMPLRIAVHQMRKHIGWYVHGMPGAAKIRANLMKLEDPDQVISALERYRDERLVLLEKS